MRIDELHVAFLVDQLGGGGAQRSAALTASALHGTGRRTTIITAVGGSYESDIPKGLTIRVLAPSWPSPGGVARFVRNLRRVVREDSVDVVFTNGFTVGRLMLMTRRSGLVQKPAVVVVERNTLSVALADRFPNRLVRGAVRRLTGWLYRRADAIVGVSDGVSRDLEVTLGLPAGSVVTIYNPVDTERITEAIVEAVPSELSGPFEALRRPVVITTGRLVAQKAHSDLLAAFALLPASRRGSLVILGEGPLRGGLEQQAERLGIADRVWMPGFVDNPWWFMARSDVFALSSHWEGHPRVLLEALACGVPVISTDCPSGAREILAGVPSTRLTTVGDPTALARAVDELLDAPPQAKPHTHLDRYRPSEVATRYADVARDVHDRHERTTPR